MNLALLVHAALGRAMRCATSLKLAIKRVDRFFGNERFDHLKAQEQLLCAAIGPRKTVFIPVDWTNSRSAFTSYRGSASTSRNCCATSSQRPNGSPGDDSDASGVDELGERVYLSDAKERRRQKGILLRGSPLDAPAGRGRRRGR